MIAPSRFQTHLVTLARSTRPSYADCVRRALAAIAATTATATATAATAATAATTTAESPPAAPVRESASASCELPSAFGWPRSSSSSQAA